MNTQEICGILETVNPEHLGFGKKSENTEFLCQIGYVKTERIMQMEFPEFQYWSGQLTDKGIRFLRQNKPDSDYFKLNGH